MGRSRLRLSEVTQCTQMRLPLVSSMSKMTPRATLEFQSCPTVSNWLKKVTIHSLLLLVTKCVPIRIYIRTRTSYLRKFMVIRHFLEELASLKCLYAPSFSTEIFQLQTSVENFVYVYMFLHVKGGYTSCKTDQLAFRIHQSFKKCCFLP